MTRAVRTDSRTRSVDVTCRLTRDNRLPQEAGIALGRTDYHAICACIEMAKLCSAGRRLLKFKSIPGAPQNDISDLFQGL